MRALAFLTAVLCLSTGARAQDEPVHLTPEEQAKIEEIEKIAEKANLAERAIDRLPVDADSKNADCTYAVGFIPRAYENKAKGMSYQDTLILFSKEWQAHPDAIGIIQTFTESVYAADRPRPDSKLLDQFKEVCLQFY